MPRHIAAALELTAVDLGPPGKDTQFGSGKFQVLDAAARLLVLGRFDTTEPVIGEQLALDLFGPANDTVFTFLALGIEDNGTNWNLTLPFLTLPAFFLDGNGEQTITFNVPNDPTLTGIPIHLQFGVENLSGLFGVVGPLLSVPERIVLTP
jgi:hypothetical protein